MRRAYRSGASSDAAEEPLDGAAAELVAPRLLEIADAGLGDRRDGQDPRRRTGHPTGNATPAGEPEREVPARRVAAGCDPRLVDVGDVGEPVDGRRDVVERPGPATSLLPDAPVLDVPRRDPVRREVDRQGRHQRAVPARPPEAAVQKDDARPWAALPGRKVEVGNLVGVLAVGDAGSGRNRAPTHGGVVRRGARGGAPARRGAGRRRPRRCRGGARRGACRPVGRRRSARRRARRRERRRRSSERTRAGRAEQGHVASQRGAELVEPCEEAIDEGADVRLDGCDPRLLDDRGACEPRVERGDRRRAGVEATRAPVRRVVGDRHREDVLVGEPAGLRRDEALVDLGPEPHEPEAGRAEQVLDGATRDGVGAERRACRARPRRRPDSCRRARARPRRARPRRSRRRRAGGPCGRRPSCSRRAPCARRSPPRSARAGIAPSSSGRTCTTSAPRSSCACAICPTVGNSYSLITIRFRPASRGSAETSALTPCDTDVVTATSSASAWSRRATLERNSSFRSTQKSHSAPFASQPASHSLDAPRGPCARARPASRS